MKTGNVIENTSPPVLSLVNNRTIYPLCRECIGSEILGIDDALASGTWTANLLCFVPLILVEPLLVAEFFWHNGATVSGETDVGVYSFDGQTRLGRSGPVANSGTSQIQVAPVTDFLLPANRRLWLALGCDNATQTFNRANLAASGLDFIGVTQQGSGWSSGLPSTITPATPTVASVPMFGFHGSLAI